MKVPAYGILLSAVMVTAVLGHHNRTHTDNYGCLETLDVEPLERKYLLFGVISDEPIGKLKKRFDATELLHSFKFIGKNRYIFGQRRSFFLLGMAVGMGLGMFGLNVSTPSRRVPLAAQCSPLAQLNDDVHTQSVTQQLLTPARHQPDSPTDDDSEARRLSKEVRVLVWVMTQPNNHATKVEAIRSTWGRRASPLLFFSSKANATLGIIAMNVSEGRQQLTPKSQAAWRYIYQNHFHDADWFMRADDDTYVVMENLRYLLSGQSPEDPVHFGHHFHNPKFKDAPNGYFSGGGGYIISKEALRRYGEQGDAISKTCRQQGAASDLAMGQCMHNLGVRIVNSTDALGRSRFHCFSPKTHLNSPNSGYPQWYLVYDANGARMGEDSMSDYTISFHYINPTAMRELDFFIYHLTPYGIVRGLQNLNRPYSKVISKNPRILIDNYKSVASNLSLS